MATEDRWIAAPSGPVMRGYSQSWAVGNLDGRSGMNLIAGVFNDGIGGDEAAERHARLLASAPDLLRVALALSNSPLTNTNALMEAKQLAKAAIAKALAA